MENQETILNEWMPLSRYEDLYEINMNGDIKSLPKVVHYSDGRKRFYDTKILKQHTTSDGYMGIRLTKDKQSKLELVHRLVAETFISNPNNLPVVNHIDGNKSNNSIDNLEWCTYSHNSQHAYDNELRDDNRKITMYDFNGRVIKVFNSIHEGARYCNGSIGNIHSVCNGLRGSASGYKWTYAEDTKISKAQILFAKTNDSVIIPSKDEANAGYDIYANFSDDFIVIPPHKTEMIPTGLVSACDPKYYFQLFERGSTGTKGMAQRCGVIDSGYRGEWFVPITNTTECSIAIMKKEALENHYEILQEAVLYPYEKAICQAVLLEVPKVEVKELSIEEIRNISSERGQGKIGSSGK